MSNTIRYRETTDPSASGHVADGLALRFDPTRRITLRFQLQVDTDEDLEALRYARRILIREERTRGMDGDEPSIEDAVFTVSEVSWSALASQVAWCRQKIDELVTRANRIRGELASEAPRNENPSPGSCYPE